MRRIDEIAWEPHPVLPDHERAVFFGASLIRGPIVNHEVYYNGEVVATQCSEEEFLDTLVELFPGCFIGEL